MVTLVFSSLDLLGLAWIDLDWLGLAWIGLDWLGLAWIDLDWLGLAWIKMVMMRMMMVMCAGDHDVDHNLDDHDQLLYLLLQLAFACDDVEI